MTQRALVTLDGDPPVAPGSYVLVTWQQLVDAGLVGGGSAVTDFNAELDTNEVRLQIEPGGHEATIPEAVPSTETPGTAGLMSAGMATDHAAFLAFLSAVTQQGLDLLAAEDQTAGRAVIAAQRADTTLTALANLATGTGKLIKSIGPDAFAMITLSAFAEGLLSAEDSATLLTAIGRGAASGVAPLDSGSKVPAAYLPAFLAPGQAEALLVSPGLWSGRGGSRGATSLTLNRIFAHPVTFSAPVVITGLAGDVSIVGAAGSVLRLGIFAHGANGLPGALLLDAGTVSATTGGLRAITGLSLALPAGTYWLAAAVQTVACSTRTYTSGSPGYQVPAVDPTGAGVYNYATPAGTHSGAFPATFGTPTLGSGQTHVVWVQTQ